MTPAERLLWQKIEAFGLDDDDSQFKFSDRLARENGWSKSYTHSVIREYRKFIFLCCISESGVTPSDPVDQAWHLHLTFTKSYWHDLCRDTLGREIHHNPAKGGKAEAKKFDSFYTSSRQQYINLFGAEPPADVWQDNHTRFSDINFRRVNLQKYWLIPRPNYKRKTRVILQLNLFALIAFISFELVVEIFYVLLALGIMVLFCWAILTYERQTDKDGSFTAGRNNRDGYEGDGYNSDGNSAGSGHHGHGGHHGGHSDSGGHHGCSSGGDSGCSGCGSGCSGCGGGGD